VELWFKIMQKPDVWPSKHVQESCAVSSRKFAHHWPLVISDVILLGC